MRDITYINIKHMSAAVFPMNLYKFVYCSLFFPAFPAWLLAQMVPSNTTTPPAPPGFMEYLAALVQNGSIPLPAPPSPAPLVAPIPAVDTPPPTEGRSFTRPGRGKGGALTSKKKVSKDIMAPATKRKALVDPEIEPQTPSNHPGKSADTKQRKRLKTANVRCSSSLSRF